MKQKNNGTFDFRTDINRRKLLSGVSAFTAGITANIWKIPTAFGADETQKGPMHFIGVFSANGTVPSAFFPASTAAESPITISEILKPLEKHAQKMMVFKGFDYRSTVENKLGEFKGGDIYNIKPGGPHMKGPAAFLTGGSLTHGTFTGSGGPAGWADRISLDQYLAKNLKLNTKFSSLEFGVRVIGQEPLQCISYSGSGQPNLPVLDPMVMYQRLFGESSKSTAELAQQLAERKSVLDMIKNDLTTLKGRLASEDKVRLEAHLTAIRSIEMQITAVGGQCKVPEKPPEGIKFNDPNRFNFIGRLQTDLQIMAHTCGLTQISTFMWANADSWQTYPWLGIPEEHHALSHANFDHKVDVDKLIKINAWHSEQVAYLMDKLAEAPASNGGNVLDNTILLWGNELGEGNTHTYKNIPLVIGGGTGGYFKTGRSFVRNAESHNNLLVSIANAMGLPEVTRFGIPELCTGPSSGIRA